MTKPTDGEDARTSEQEGPDPIDESMAWELVRVLTPVQRARVGNSWLECDASGDRDADWHASAPVTDDARDLLDLFVPLRSRDGLVIGQLGQSLDGRIATESGASHYVTSPADLTRLHRLRALVDAVVVGATTVAADDPQLTVRRVPGPNPVRVILDPRGRLPMVHRVFSDGHAPTLLIRNAPIPSGGVGAHVEVLPVPLAQDGLDLTALLETLRERGLARILIEGGGVTVSGFLQAGLLDRLHIAVAPLLIGSGRPSISLDPIQTLDQAIRPRCRIFRLGPDVLFDLDLREARA